MVATAGAGPKPIPASQLNSANLAEAIRFCLAPETKSAAASLAIRMKSESGVRRAVATFHANLPLERMRCDLLPNLPAAWQYSKGGRVLKLSKAAAQSLLNENRISRRELTR